MTTINEYLEDSRIIVRVDGVEFCKLPAQQRDRVAEIDMGDNIVIRHAEGLVTVNSRDASRPVRKLGMLPFDMQEARPMRYSHRGYRSY